MAVTLSVLAGGPRAGSAGRLHTRTGTGTLHEQVDSKRLLYMLTATQGPKNRTRARRPVPSSLVGWVATTSHVQAGDRPTDLHQRPAHWHAGHTLSSHMLQPGNQGTRAIRVVFHRAS